MEKTAKRIKTLDGFTGFAELFELYPPFDGHRFVIASATNAPFTGPETLVFPVSDGGRVTDWGEIGGGRGYLDPSLAIERMGYNIR